MTITDAETSQKFRKDYLRPELVNLGAVVEMTHGGAVTAPGPESGSPHGAGCNKNQVSCSD